MARSRLLSDVWEVELSTDRAAFLDLLGYELALGTLWSRRHEASATTQGGFVKQAGAEPVSVGASTQAFAIAVPAGTTSLPCAVDHLDDSDGVSNYGATLQPGSYVVGKSGLVPR